MTKPLTGRGVLLWLFAFFGIIFATNAYFITISVKTFRGEDEQKPYLQGVEYNDTLARRAEQRKIGWQANVSAARLNSGQVRISVGLTQANGQPETKTALHGELRHPADENKDRDLILKETQPGLYQTELSGVAPGSWDVLVSNSDKAAPFEAVRRLWVP
jgi:nitrogen fixation protein FixH